MKTEKIVIEWYGPNQKLIERFEQDVPLVEAMSLYDHLKNELIYHEVKDTTG